mmetsp:Transcript_26964/g.80852  ORF Transcript_26964/g.80852 Transcript_26964/m.80852 type:complete len:325 (-) Transcript_26964:7-981(-)
MHPQEDASDGEAASDSRYLTNAQITWCSGTIAGFAATFAKQPIQRVKWIRQTSETTRTYAEITRATWRGQGAAGFFAGSAAAVYRNVPHSVLVYTLYPHASALTRKVSGGPEESFWSRFGAGYITMVGATIVTHPLDTLRVRVSVQTDKASFLETARRLRRSDGLGGFYGGFGATLLGAGPRGAIGFGVFETLKPRLAGAPYFAENPALAKVVCGFLAGLLSESFIYPLDTVRRRQQTLGSAHPMNRMGALAALGRIAAVEGFGGLFKGISLNLVKNPMATAISFSLNDYVKEALGYRGEAPPKPGLPRQATGLKGSANYISRV